MHADETVKIGDFGMARDIYYQEYYRPAGRRMMPVNLILDFNISKKYL